VRIYAQNRSEAVSAVSEIPEDRFPLVLNVSRSGIRSIEQNRRYWALLRHVSEQMRQVEGAHVAPETLHKMLASLYAPVEENPITHEYRPKGTSSMTVAEFSEYLDRCCAFFSIDFSEVDISE
jgi:hypothetical protein